jgi:hypothetical protein
MRAGGGVRGSGGCTRAEEGEGEAEDAQEPRRGKEGLEVHKCPGGEDWRCRRPRTEREGLSCTGPRRGEVVGWLRGAKGGRWWAELRGAKGGR